MEIINIEKKIFETMLDSMEVFLDKLERYFNRLDDNVPGDWIDSQDVCLILNISPRTLQTLRTNGSLPYSRLNNKIYYNREDIKKTIIKRK